MNKLMLAIIASLTAFSTQAKQMSRDTSYFRDPLLQRFTGTWEYVGNDTKFKIILKTEKAYSKFDNLYYDHIVSNHFFEKSGKESQNSVGKEPTITLGHYFNKDVSKDVLEITFYDKERPNPGRALLSLLPNGKLSWDLRDKGNSSFVDSHGKLHSDGRDHNFYVPRKIILTKVN